MARTIASSTPIMDRHPSENKARILVGKIPASIIAGSLAAIISFVVYLLTMAQDITWSHFGGDGGELITAAVTLGIPHPPGYPTYVLLGHLFSKIPIGTIAWRFNFFSAIAGTLAVAFVTITSYNFLQGIPRRFLAAVAGGLTFAFAPLVWSQTIITEVYALNIAILAAFMWALLGKKSPWLTGIFLGLGITTHLSSLLLIPLALFLTDFDQRKKVVLGTLFGLLPLITLPVLGGLNSPVIWGDPSTLKGWWALISGRLYQPNLQITAATFNLTTITKWSVSILSQFAWIGWIIVVIGVLHPALSRRKIAAILGTVFLFASFSLFYKTDDAIINFMPGLLLLSPILAAGLARLGYFSILLPLLLLTINFQQQNLRKEQPIRQNVIEIMKEIPQDAILLAPGDQTIFTMWYFHHIENLREDLTLVDKNLLAFDWYRRRLSSQYPFILGIDRDDVQSFIKVNSTKRQVCELSLREPQLMFCSPVSGY